MFSVVEIKNWPKFSWDRTALAARLARVRYEQGRLIGRLEGSVFSFHQEVVLRMLTEDVLKSSEIEGEILDRALVCSSLARRLRIGKTVLQSKHGHLEGVVEMMLEASRSYSESLAKDRLFGWHASMFPTGRSGMTRIRVGERRAGAQSRGWPKHELCAEI